MELVSVLRMNGGDGENSYARNSSVQSIIQSEAKRMVQEAIQEYCSSYGHLNDCLRIADLGCSSGPNSLAAIFDIIAFVADACEQVDLEPPECQLYLNDLPGNDFNSVFRSLQGGGPGYGNIAAKQCYFSGVPGSFYERLFPSGSIHFFHSSSSLHWLSQVPHDLQSGKILNKRNLYIAKNSPKAVIEAYYNQFQRDFSSFLKMRAKETVPGGRMVLTFTGRRNRETWNEETHFMVDLLTKSLQDMALEGIIEEEKLDTLNLPIYFPCVHEVMIEIEREGSFCLKGLKVLGVNISKYKPQHKNINIEEKSTKEEESKEAYNYSKCMQAVTESIITTHFGEVIINELFKRYTQVLTQFFQIKRAMIMNLVISLERIVED